MQKQKNYVESKETTCKIKETPCKIR